MTGYEEQVIKVFRDMDRRAIGIVKTLKDDVLYVRAMFQKYGVTPDNCTLRDTGIRLTLREMASPQTPTDEEVARFNQAEERVSRAVNNHSLPIILQTAIAANVEMMYFDPHASFDTIDDSVVSAEI